ncbi:MAG: hypothetical protein IJX94_01880 [Clostridia bacterium]|nr:hypothetical protein [Clostridia bacterium]
MNILIIIHFFGSSSPLHLRKKWYVIRPAVLYVLLMAKHSENVFCRFMLQADVRNLSKKKNEEGK